MLLPADTLPPVATEDGVTLPTAGLPLVPAGTVMVILFSVDVVAVVKV